MAFPDQGFIGTIITVDEKNQLHTSTRKFDAG